MRISTVYCARTPNLEIAFFSGDFLTAGGAFPWRRQDRNGARNGALLDFAQAQSPEGKVCGDEGEVPRRGGRVKILSIIIYSKDALRFAKEKRARRAKAFDKRARGY